MTFFLDHDVPDDVTYALRTLGHEVIALREVLPASATDREAFRYASDRGYLLITCNRDDFLSLAKNNIHSGIIILKRRGTRLAERHKLIQLLDRSGEAGLRGNINFA